MGFNYLFIYPPSYVALCGSKAHHRLGSETVSWCLETSLFLKTPFPGWSSIPTSFVSLFIFCIFSYLLSKTLGCFSGCLMSSAGIQKLFVEFTQRSNVLLMNLWGRKWSPCLFLHHLLQKFLRVPVVLTPPLRSLGADRWGPRSPQNGHSQSQW